jgi:type III secretory pathway component EscT
LLVPAFGLRALPATARTAIGLALAIGIAPALAPLARSGEPWPVLLLGQVARGLPVALGAAAVLWAATMAGGLTDELRGSRDATDVPVVERGATPTAVLLGLLAGLAFLESGGPVHIAETLAAPELGFAGPLARAAVDLRASVVLAVGVAAPVLGASVIVELAGALVTRAASPAPVASLLAPVRSLALLGVAALVLDRMVEVLVVASHQRG